jgi:predicted cupin superfamily sugar epimerase
MDCTVGPGFEFEDFEMLMAGDPRIEAFTTRHPMAAEFL